MDHRRDPPCLPQANNLCDVPIFKNVPTVNSSFGMIEEQPGTNWYDLQQRVAAILGEAGLAPEVGRILRLARGTAEIDVYATDPTTTPSAVYLCECKRWSTRVPQAEVQTFRTIVSDAGAPLRALHISGRLPSRGVRRCEAHKRSFARLAGVPKRFSRALVQHLLGSYAADAWRPVSRVRRSSSRW